jgi:hypothetical protein
MSRLGTLLVLSSFFVPLVALLLVSLGVVLLKRGSGRSPWITRVTTPPFYLVSLPIATLIVGAEMLGWYSLFVTPRLLSPDGFSWDFRFLPFFLNPIPAFFAAYFSMFFWFPALIVFFVSFWAAVFVSGGLLWRKLWREDHHRRSSRAASVRLRGLLLLILFAWSFTYLMTYIGWVTAPWGPSS